jgi:hypothetical protein
MQVLSTRCWMKAISIGGLATMEAAELLGPLYDQYNSFTNRGTQAQQLLSPQLNSSSIQTRYQATQSYNAATGASAPQSRLWVTPNGAVINWNGASLLRHAPTHLVARSSDL